VANPALQGGFDLAHASGAYVAYGVQAQLVSDAGAAAMRALN